MRKISAVFIAILSGWVLAGCSTAPAPKPSITSVRDLAPDQAKGTVLISTITDSRDRKGESDAYFGTIRGGYGNPVERMYFAHSASDFVQKHFQLALSAQGYRIVKEPQPSTLTLTGNINALWGKNVPWALPAGAREVELNVTYELKDPDGTPVWQDTLAAFGRDKESVGMSGSTPIFEGWLAKLLQDEILKSIKSFEQKRPE